MDNEDDDEIDCEYTDYVTCPHCGFEDDDCWFEDDPDTDSEILECPECGKHFYAYKHVSISFSTEKVKIGTCAKCGKHNKILEDYSGLIGNFKDYCLDCKKKEITKLEKEYYIKAIKELEEQDRRERDNEI